MQDDLEMPESQGNSHPRPRKSRRMRLLLRAFTVFCVLAGILAIPFLLRKNPRSTGRDLSKSILPVGFDLTASYGSAAIAFPNGSTVTLAKVSGEEVEGYDEMLARLSLETSQHLSPPYNEVGDSWKDMPRQWARKARKAVGLPASADVGRLANMVSKLKAAVEERVGTPIILAGVTTMNLVALYDEDLHDAFEYVETEYVTFPIGAVGRNILHETAAAYAGYGLGLSADYKTDPDACKEEQYNMDDTIVMAVVYTDTVLSVSLSLIRSAFALWEPQYRYIADFELGFAKADHDQYWPEVKSVLQKLMIDNPNYPRPQKVLLMGDRVDDADFKESLNKALRPLVRQMPEIYAGEPVGVSGRGVAEMTKRHLFEISPTSNDTHSQELK